MSRLACCRRIGPAFLALALLFSQFSTAMAAPAYPVVKNFEQPGGQPLQLRLWGDEFIHGYETLDGFTVLLNETTGYWEYAARDSFGRLSSSNIVVGQGFPPLRANIRPSKAAFNEARAEEGAAPMGVASLDAAPAWAGPDTDLLFLLVGFTDVPCTFTAAQHQANMFGGAATGPGNLADYFAEISYGAFDVVGTVAGCFNLPNTKAYYDTGAGSDDELVNDAIALANPTVDFSNFDNDNDGVVDALGIIYAGGGPHDGCDTDDGAAGSGGDDLWPHATSLPGAGTAVDGVNVDPYIINSEVTFGVNPSTGCTQIQTIGLFAHELGHSLGLPDLYDTDNSSQGLDDWSAMASQYASTVNLADTPAHYDAWSKWFEGWITPENLTNDDLAAHPINQVATNPHAIRLLANPGGPEIGGSGEYFLIENRQRVGFDSALPGCGLIVWHIEESQPFSTANQNEGHTPGSHRLVDIEEADGLDELDLPPSNANARADAGDPFPGSTGNREISDSTTPHLQRYDGSNSNQRVWDISDCAPAMLANFNDPQADLEITKTAVPHPIVIAGEELLYYVTVRNLGEAGATSVVMTDTLPAEVVYIDDNADCDASALPQLVCDLDTIAAGDSRTVIIKTRVPADTVALENDGTLVIVNTAEVFSDVIDPDLSNNVVEYQSFVQEAADLKISKLLEPHTTIRAGEVFTYTIYVDNLGPSVSRNVTITDTLLSSGRVSIQSCAFSVSQGGGAITQFTCTTGNLVSTQFGSDIGTFRTNMLEPLTPTSQGRLRASFRLVANQDISVNNTARVSALTPDPDMSNNMAMIPIEVTGVTDLVLTKAATGEEQQVNQTGLMFNNAIFGQAFPTAPNYFVSTRVTAGRRIQYQLTVSNSGPSRAERVVLEDRLPTGVRIYQGSVVVTLDPNGAAPAAPLPAGTCNTGTPGDPLDKLRCEFGTLEVGDVATLGFEVITDANLAPGTVLENDALVTADTLELDTTDNLRFTQNTVLTSADLSVAKSAVGETVIGYDAARQQLQIAELSNQVTAGKHLRYQIQVQNNGPSDSQNVTLQEDLPVPVVIPALPSEAVTFLGATGADCRPSSLDQQRVFCTVGDLAAGERKTFDIYVSVAATVPHLTQLLNTVTALHSGSNTVPPGAPPSIPGLDPIRPLTWDSCASVACAGAPQNNNVATNTTTVNAVSDVGGPGGPGGAADNSIQKWDLPAEARLDKAVEPDDAIAGLEHRYRIRFGTQGPSLALGVTLVDQLDFKQAGIAGERFLRCESADGASTVSCSYNAATNQVTLLSYVDGDGTAFAGGLGTLVPGKSYAFDIVVEVDAGYVLDADDFIARNSVRIATATLDFNQANDADIEDTRIIAEADLSLTKTDVFGDPLANPGNAFLMCDPVQPGGMITYTLTVSNDGPSDAADVYLVDQLPANYVVVDPAQVVVTVDDGEVISGEVIEIRDDGRITVRIGNDRNNAGAPELGRLNSGSTATVNIAVMVRRDAKCGGLAENHAYVETRLNNADWPPAPDWLPGIGGGPRTPTFDPDESNNHAIETTKIECPKIKVNKTVSYDGTCPGADITTINVTGEPVTFCFEITNTGTTYLDTILITDTLTTRTSMPTIIYTATITSGIDPKVPVAPGETVKRQVTVEHLTKHCGIATDTVEVTAIPVNSGRTVYPCLSPVADQDSATIEIPCAGLDWRVSLPYLGGPDCQTWLQVQNVGDRDTKALLVVWGDPGFCPPQAAGPLKVECTGLLRPGSAWSFAMAQVPTGARSAIAYSMNATDLVTTARGNQRIFADVACDALFQEIVGSHMLWAEFDLAYRQRQAYYGAWDNSGLHQTVLDFAKHQGEPLVVSVNRNCPDVGDPNVRSNAAYAGLSRDMLGVRDPASGAYMYYAPLIFAANSGLNTVLWLQNVGDECTSLEIWLKGQDNCLRPIIGDILTLSPGESFGFDPNTVVGPDWLGSAWIRATQPIGIVVDSMGTNHFTSYVGVAADNDPLHYSAGNQVNFAPLIYSEYQGWDTAIQVQNLSPVTNAKVKVYFLDRSGDVITTLVDWICPRGSQTFFLPTIAALGGNWVGSARIESQDWWAPGTNQVDYPKIASVVLLEKWSDPARTTRREAMAYNGQTECLLYDWQVGNGKGGTQSGSAVFAVPLLSKGNRGVNSELAITNLVAKPGFTDFAIFIYDQNGLLDFVCEKLHDRQVEYIDLATWGYVPPNFMGSAVVSATFWEHDVFDPSGNFARNLVGLGGVVVERVGARQGEPDIPGDESKAFEAIPVFDHFEPENWLGQAPRCPGQPGFGP